MGNIYEEYVKYNELSSEKRKLNDELLTLVGKNDNDSIRKINQIAERLGEIRDYLSRVNEKELEVVADYYKGLDDISKLAEDIKLIEKISKKSNGEKVEVISCEGRKKLIDKEYELEYRALAARKKKLRSENLSNYNYLKGITSILEPRIEGKIVTSDKKNNSLVYETDYENSSDESNLEQQIAETRELIDRIIQSTKMPNMGKKVLVSFDNKKYYIPKKYKGRFDNAIGRLNRLLKPKKVEINREGNDKSDDKDNVYYVSKLNLPTIEEMLIEEMVINNKTQVKLDPRDITFRKPMSISLQKAYVCVKKKVSVDNFIKMLPEIYNIDKKMLLALEKIEGRLLDRGIQIKTTGVALAKGVIKTYDTAKDHVMTISKNTCDKVIAQYRRFNKYIDMKKSIVSNINSGIKVQEAMEEVYGDSRNKHLDYVIVNRAVRFNENVCLRVNEARNSIINVNKSVIDKISRPFRMLRENMQNDIQRKELEEEIEKVRRENLNKSNELKKIRIKENSGYVAMGILTLLGTLLMAALIFAVIGNLLR